jgi:hypothetical protein
LEGKLDWYNILRLRQAAKILQIIYNVGNYISGFVAAAAPETLKISAIHLIALH